MSGSSTSQRRLSHSSLETTWTTLSSLSQTTLSTSRFAIGSKPQIATSVRSQNTGMPYICRINFILVIVQQKEQSGKSTRRVLPQREAFHALHRAGTFLQALQAKRHPTPGLLSATNVSWYGQLTVILRQKKLNLYSQEALPTCAIFNSLFTRILKGEVIQTCLAL